MAQPKKTTYGSKIRKILRKDSIPTDPILLGVLEELDRLESIRDALYSEYESKPLMEGYTNKAGATNLVVSAAVKEYKMYSQRFNELTKTLDRMIAERMPDKQVEQDPLDMLNARDRL